MKEILVYIFTLPVRLYVISWSYFLILCKRRVPKWLAEKMKEEINWQPTGKPEPYRR